MAGFGKLHYVNVGPGGTFAASGALVTTPADVDALFAHLGPDAALKKVALYFHGGLVKEAAGLAVARKMWELFEGHAHVVGFVWETGPFETIKNNLETIQETALFKKLLKYAIRHAASRLGGVVGGRGPGQPPTIAEVEAELAKASRFDAFDAGARGAAASLTEAELDEDRSHIEAELEGDLEADSAVERLLETEAPVTPLLDPRVAASAKADAARGIGTTLLLAKRVAAVVVRVVRRFIRKRDHGLYPTVVEETLREFYLADFGAWLWGGMKDAASEMWSPNVGLAGPGRHAGTYFLQKLADLKQAKPALAIDLFGHSAGSIAICHLLSAAAARHPELTFRNVVFLAPACTCDLFRAGILGHTDRFTSFRMFTMRDELETADRLLPAVYTRSLLYLISGILEAEADAPIAGLELQTRGAAPYATPELLQVATYLRATGAHRLVLSESLGAGQGLNSAAKGHGAFDDDLATRESLLSMASQ